MLKGCTYDGKLNYPSALQKSQPRSQGSLLRVGENPGNEVAKEPASTYLINAGQIQHFGIVP